MRQSGCDARPRPCGDSVATVSDGHDGRRRAGDDTRGRIDQLADGWAVPTAPRPETDGPDIDDPALDVATDQTRVLDDDDTADYHPRPASPTPAVAGPWRRAGVLGDVRYLVTGGLALRRARRERAALDLRLTDAHRRRDRALIALAAQAVSTTSLDHPALDDARTELAILEHDHREHDRARTEAAAAAFALRREHEDHTRARLTEITTLERALAVLAEREAPLERDVTRVRKRQVDLAAELDRLDATRDRLEAQRRRLPLTERAAHDAELESGRVNREMVARDRPVLDADLAALRPRLAAIEAARAEAQARLDTARNALGARAAQIDGELRTLAARSVELDRAGADARGARDARLAALGELLVRERPTILRAPLRELDDLDAAIATDRRRRLDLDELTGAIDRRARGRGAAIVLMAVALTLAILGLVR